MSTHPVHLLVLVGGGCGAGGGGGGGAECPLMQPHILQTKVCKAPLKEGER